MPPVTKALLAPLIAALLPAAALAETPLLSATDPHLSGEQVTLPLVLVKGYPFIEGTIDGTRGKLMFDLGDVRTLTVDTHTVPIGGGVVIGTGFFGSGQSFQTMRLPRVERVDVAGQLHFEGLSDVLGHPGLPIEQHITPDFIGWLGLKFFKGYVARIDYAVPEVRFYREDGSGAGMAAAAGHERVIQTIALGNAAHPNLSTFPVTVGDAALTGIVDTGSHNTIWLSEAQVSAMKQAGTLREQGDGKALLSGVRIDGRALPPMVTEINTSPPPFAKLLPEPGAPLLTLGYEFLSLGKTVWDFDRGTLTLLESGKP